MMPATKRRSRGHGGPSRTRSGTCRFCNRWFSREDNMLRHENAVHRKLIYNSSQSFTKSFGGDNQLSIHRTPNPGLAPIRPRPSHDSFM